LTLIRVLGDRVPAIQAQLEASEVTLDLYLKQFLVGRREIADLIGAENERMDALISKIEVEVEQARLGAAIASELGQLEDRLLDRLPVAKPEGA
jgi:outer membrane protein TolC